MTYLALPPSDPALVNPTVLSTLSTKSKLVEPVGHNYQAYFHKIQASRSGVTETKTKDEGKDKSNDEGSGKSDDEDTKQDRAFDQADMNKKRKQKRDTAINNYIKKNHYELLGLEDVSSDEKAIKKAFRNLSLIYHPDKYEEGAYNENAKQKWLNLQEAHETLCDKEKRRIYDSTMEFDDYIPEDTLPAGADFFEIYAPILKRNAYWHTDPKKIGELGNANTPIDKVMKYYKSWESFKSWRDFTMEDEYDVMQAEDRYEKRWMEKNNMKMKKDLYKKEARRIHKLLDNAKKSDPRVIKKEKEDAERIAKVQSEKEDRKRSKIEGVQKIAREKKEAEEKIIRDAAEKREREIAEKKTKRQFQAKIKQDFKDALANNLPEGLKKYDRFWADEFVKKLKEDQIIKTAEKMNTMESPEAALDWLEDFIAAITGVAAKKTELPSNNSKKTQCEDWSKDEISLLTKAIIKYPAGMTKRWDLICNFIGGRKSISQVTKMCNELKSKSLMTPEAVQNKIETQVQEEEAARVQEAKVQEAKVQEAKVQEAKAQEEARVKEAKAQEARAQEAKVQEAKVPETKGKETKGKKNKGKVQETKGKVQEAKIEEKQPVKIQEKQEVEPTKVDGVTNGVEWTQEEQVALQKAMKTFPASIEVQERWGKIAETVGNGKTKKDCLTRVKEIKAKLSKK